MLLDQKVEVTCVPINKEYLLSKGYEWKFKNKIIIHINDLQEGSHKKVKVMCDYCGEIFTRTYKNHIQINKTRLIKKDCCKDCNQKKTQESIKLKYGDDYYESKFIDTLQKGLKEKYGVTNAKYIDESQKKDKVNVRNSHTFESAKEFAEEHNCEALEFNGYDHEFRFICSCGKEDSKLYYSFLKNPICIECALLKVAEDRRIPFEIIKENVESKNCTLIRYEGTTNSKMLIKHNICGRVNETTYHSFSRSKTGCPYCSRRESIINRNITFYENGTAPISFQQEKLNTLIGGELNFPINKYSIDIAYVKDKIAIEYDGSGHDAAVKNFKSLTREEFEEKERTRTNYLLSKGWRLIRYVSTKDILTENDDDLINLHKFCLWLSDGFDVLIIDFDNKIIDIDGRLINYNFPNLKVWRKMNG